MEILRRFGTKFAIFILCCCLVKTNGRVTEIALRIDALVSESFAVAEKVKKFIVWKLMEWNFLTCVEDPAHDPYSWELVR